MSKITEKQSVTSVKDVTTHVVCDVCKVKVAANQHGQPPDTWHHLSAHHSNWNHDSVDSYEYYDACGPSCYVECLRKALVEFEDDRDTAQIGGMSYNCAKELFQYVDHLEDVKADVEEKIGNVKAENRA